MPVCTREGLSAGQVAQAPGRPHGDVNVDGNVQLDMGVLGRVRYTDRTEIRDGRLRGSREEPPSTMVQQRRGS